MTPPTTIRLTPERKRRLLAAARSRQMTMTAYIALAVDEQIKRDERAGRIQGGEQSAYSKVFKD